MMGGDPGLHNAAKDDLIRRNGRDLTTLAASTGLVILACHLESGARRWAAAIWESALKVPGAPASWGAAILAASALMYFGRRCDTPRTRRLYRIGCKASSVWFSAVAFFWGLAVVDDLLSQYVAGDSTAGVANPFGIPMCVYVAFIFARRAHMANDRHYG